MGKQTTGQGTKRVRALGRSGPRLSRGDFAAYMASLPDAERTALEKVRSAVTSVAKDCEELISYQVPTFRYKGRNLVSFAAFKDHCSFFVMSPSVVEALKDELAGYSTSKGTIHFPSRKPLPAALIRKIVKARIAENAGG